MQNTGTHASLRGLSVVNDKLVWASGTGGTYLRTTDGGRTWAARQVPGAEGLDFRGVKAFDAMTALLMSSGPAEKGQARIYRTTDGGQHWSEVFASRTPGVFLDAIAFWDRNHGIAVGDPVGGHFFLITSDDGGKSWQQVAADRLPAALPNEGAFAASNSCLFMEGSRMVWFGTGGAARARVFRSTDRGRSWAVADTPVQAGTASAGIFSLYFRYAQHGVTVGGDYREPMKSSANVALTADGGRSWKLAASFPAGLFLSSVIEGFAVGTSGTAYSRDGEHWEKLNNTGFNVIATAGGKAVWAAGSEGRIGRLEKR